MPAPPRLALALAAVLPTACASLGPCAGGEQSMVEEALYFGTQTPDGTVTAAQWSEFLRSEVTPRFPQGLTVWPASGQWRAADGSIKREASYVLTVLHEGDPASEAAVRGIAAAYKQRFRQEAVMRVQMHACVSF